MSFFKHINWKLDVTKNNNTTWINYHFIFFIFLCQLFLFFFACVYSYMECVIFIQLKILIWLLSTSYFLGKKISIAFHVKCITPFPCLSCKLSSYIFEFPNIRNSSTKEADLKPRSRKILDIFVNHRIKMILSWYKMSTHTLQSMPEI